MRARATFQGDWSVDVIDVNSLTVNRKSITKYYPNVNTKSIMPFQMRATYWLHTSEKGDSHWKGFSCQQRVCYNWTCLPLFSGFSILERMKLADVVVIMHRLPRFPKVSAFAFSYFSVFAARTIDHLFSKIHSKIWLVSSWLLLNVVDHQKSICLHLNIWNAPRIDEINSPFLEYFLSMSHSIVATISSAAHFKGNFKISN